MAESYPAETPQPIQRPTDPVSSNALNILIEKAREYPRQINTLMQSALRELEAVPELAERAYYSIPYKEGDSKRMIEGLSIKAAMALGRHWGNIATDGRIIGEDESNFYVKGFCIDLENNIQNSTEVRVSKYYKPRGGQGIKPWSSDMLRNQVLSGISKARRNAVLMTIPEWLKDYYHNKAKELVIEPKQKTGNVESIQTRIEKGFQQIEKQFQITQLKMKEYMIEYFDGVDNKTYLVQLKAIYNALKDGLISKEEIQGKKPLPAMPSEKKKDGK